MTPDTSNLSADVAALKEKVAGMEKAADTLADNLARVPTGLDRLQAQIYTVLDERLKATQFQIEAAKTAAEKTERTVAASMQKMETALEGKIASLNVLMDANQKVSDKREGSDTGRGAQMNLAIALALVIIAALSLWNALSHLSTPVVAKL